MASTVGTGPASAARPAGADSYDDPGRGYGWVIFAGTMLAIVATLNIIYGIAAIGNSKFYARDVTYVVSSLNTWGWVLLCVGIIQFGAALSIWARTSWGRWVGVLTASVNAILQLVVISQYPFVGVSLFAVDILVIYGLVAYGGRPRTA